MKKNPALIPQPNCGHYAACSQRMLEIKVFSKRLFYYTVFSGIAIIAAIFIGSAIDLGTELNYSLSGAFSFLPLMISDPAGTGFIFLHLFEAVAVAVLGTLGLSKFKVCHIVLLGFYLFSLLGACFTKECPLLSIGTLICAVGVVLSFQSIGVFLDYNQLFETEGYPYFSELFEIPESSAYKPLYQEQYKNLPKNPVRRFGDNAPIPLKPDQLMNDIIDTPVESPLLKRENHLNDAKHKDLFEEV